MKIQELAGADLSIFQEILASFAFSAEQEKNLVQNFAFECQEIGANRVIFVAKLSDTPVSIVQLILKNADNNPALANGHDIAHIHGLWVRKDYQRQGIAEKVMRHCEVYSQERGIKTLTLGVDDYNSGAIALYTKLNYLKFAEEEGRVPSEKLFLMRKTQL